MSCVPMGFLISLLRFVWSRFGVLMRLSLIGKDADLVQSPLLWSVSSIGHIQASRFGGRHELVPPFFLVIGRADQLTGTTSLSLKATISVSSQEACGFFFFFTESASSFCSRAR